MNKNLNGNTQARNPYLWLCLGGVLLSFLCSVHTQLYFSSAGLGVMFVAALAIGAWGLQKRKTSAPQSGFLFAAWALLVSCVLYSYINAKHPAVFISVAGICCAAIAAGCFLLRGTLTAKRICILIGLISMLLHLIYILYTPVATRQHDVSWFNQQDGHYAYIQYLVDNNFTLPAVSPQDYWQFYHPPLHHLLSALFIKTQLFLGLPDYQTYENLQFLTWIYSGAITIASYKLLKQLGLKGVALCVSFSILAMHPAFVLLSGSANNDILFLLFSILAILHAVRWYQAPNYANIVRLAICIGLSMMAKLNGALIAPAALVLFFYHLYQNRRKPWPLLCQFLVFGLICVPLGLWWSVRLHTLFQLPFGFVNPVPTGTPQDISAVPLIAKLFLPDATHLQSVFVRLNAPAEHNFLLSLLKHALFDEFALFKKGAGLQACVALFAVQLPLVFSALVGGIYTARYKTKLYTTPIKLFFAVLFATVVLMYFSFNMQHPQTCTTGFRYVVPTLWVGAIWLGMLITQLQKKGALRHRIVVYTLSGLSGVFCTLSFVVYTLLSVS